MTAGESLSLRAQPLCELYEKERITTPLQVLQPDLRMDQIFCFMIQGRGMLCAVTTLVIRPWAPVVTIVFLGFVALKPPETHVH